jgi:hypothetical protein
MTYRAYGVCCGLFHSRDVAVQRLYSTEHATSLRETKPCFNIDGVFYGRCWHFIFRRCSATSLPN